MVILSRLGLTRADLFSGPPLTGEQLAVLEAERETWKIVHRRQRQWLMEPCDGERKWQAVADSLILKLVLAPGDQALATLYHFALDQVRTWRAEAERREAHAKTQRNGDTRCTQ